MLGIGETSSGRRWLGFLGGPRRGLGRAARRPDDPSSTPWPDVDVTDHGERIAPEDNNFCFFAHLSIYTFAVPYVLGKRVLDAGCGTGYGSHYLLEAGARSVLGVDLSAKVIGYCQRRYDRPGLRYEVMDLQQARFAPWQRFDVIYTSNVMEHLADPDAGLSGLVRVLKPGGVFILAVPPIVSAAALRANLENVYHLTNITPRHWLTKLRRYFQHARGYRHWVEPEFVGPDRRLSASDNIREGNFTFTEKSDEEMMTQESITTVLVARGPRRVPLPAQLDERALPPEWRCDAPDRS